MADKIRLLIVMNDSKALEQSVPMLVQNGFEVRFARNIVACVGQVTHFKPHAILLSWNLPRYNIKELYNTLSERLNALILVFSEVTNPTVVMRLNNSGIPQTLLPPLNADGISKRIKGILKKRSAPADKSEGKLDTIGGDLVAASEIQETLEWSLLNVPKRGQESERILLWTADSRQTGSCYLFEGAIPPVFDTIKKVWDTGDEKPVFVQIGARDKSLVNALKNKASLGEEVLVANHDEAAPQAVPLPVKPMHVIEKCLRAVLSELAYVIAESPIDTSPVTNVCAVVFRSQKFQGYLISSNSVDCFDPDLMLKISAAVVHQVNRFGEQIQPLEGEPMLMTFSPKVLETLLAESSTFQVVIRHKGHRASFTFLSGAELPRIVERADRDYVAMPVDFLVGETTVEFDVFLSLPSNGKFILYRKRGSTVSGATLENLRVYNCKNIYVSKDEMDLAKTYQLKHQLAARSASKKPA